MDVKELLNSEYEELILKKKENVEMILAYHTLGKGRCFGGIRLLPTNYYERAFKDALRLSEAMQEG